MRGKPRNANGAENGKNKEIMAEAGTDNTGAQQAGRNSADGLQGMHQSPHFGSVKGIVQLRNRANAGLLQLHNVLNDKGRPGRPAALTSEIGGRS